MSKNRREFIRTGSIVGLGIALLNPLQGMNLFDSEINCPFPGYVPNAPEKTSISQSFSNTMKVEVKGRIWTKNLTRLSNAKVEVWHCDSKGNLGKNTGYRTSIKTDSEGNYKFQTDLPGRYNQKAGRIYFRVTDEKSKVTYAELTLSSIGDAFIDDKHWVKNKDLGDRVTPKAVLSSSNTKVNFDFIAV